MSEHDPIPPPGAPDDRELDDFLLRKSPLSQAYREALPHERVPDNVDAAVKAWAKREHDQHLGKRGRWWDRAALPLGAAASLILVALLVNKGRESGVSERAAMREATSGAVLSAEDSTSAAPAAKARPQAAEPATAPAPPAAPVHETEAKAESARSRDQAVTMQQKPVVSANAPLPVAAAPAPPPASAAADASVESSQPTAAVEDRARGAAEEKSANAPAQRLAGVMSSAGNAAMKSAGATAAAPASPPTLAAAAPAPFPAAPAAEKAPPAPTLASDRQLEHCDQAEPGAAFDSRAYPPAEPWLAGIRSLREANQSQIAQRQLRCWQRVYPRAAVPDDLKALLDPP